MPFAKTLSAALLVVAAATAAQADEAPIEPNAADQCVKDLFTAQADYVARNGGDMITVPAPAYAIIIQSCEAQTGVTADRSVMPASMPGISFPVPSKPAV